MNWWAIVWLIEWVSLSQSINQPVSESVSQSEASSTCKAWCIKRKLRKKRTFCENRGKCINMAEIEGELLGFVEIWGICNKIAICIIGLGGMDASAINHPVNQFSLYTVLLCIWLSVCVCLSVCLSFAIERIVLPGTSSFVPCKMAIFKCFSADGCA